MAELFDQIYFFNCFQTKFVAILIVLLVFFLAIFRLTDFSSDAFDFFPRKRDKQAAPYGH